MAELYPVEDAWKRSPVVLLPRTAVRTETIACVAMNLAVQSGGEEYRADSGGPVCTAESGGSPTEGAAIETPVDRIRCSLIDE